MGRRFKFPTVRPVRGLLRDVRANVAVTFSLLGLLLILLAFTAVDLSDAFASKNALQDATDAATLAAATEISKNPGETKAQLQAVAQGMLAADFTRGVPSVSSFHVCTAALNDCAGPSGPMKMNTIAMQTSANAPCLLFGLSPLCGTSSSVIPVTASTTTTINFGVTMQINVLMDSSASMIVGATSADVAKISTWVLANWSLVKPLDPGPPYKGDNPPCAFACHDVDSATTGADVALGLTHAQAAGATTRFDVMIAAAQGLITHLQTEAATSSRVPQNTVVFNIMSFDTSLHTYGGPNLDYGPALTAVGQVSPGLDTWMSNAMTQVISQVGANGTGASAASPAKLVILVTDGLQSDRVKNYTTCASTGFDAAWNYANTCYGGFATTISAAQCAQLKNNGVILAVLETPYVPLTGQDPVYAPYEHDVRHVIYPGGPGSPSVVSAALSSCASPGFYFQAVNASDIATGFTTLTDQFINQTTRISN